MGFFDSFMGNASNADPQQVVESLRQDRILLPQEEVLNAFKLFRDLVVFTDWRIIAIDVQGLAGRRGLTRPFPIVPLAALR
nr:PH domain-containing protein [Corynebacterium pilosum]